MSPAPATITAGEPGESWTLLLFPEAASTFAGNIDALYWALTGSSAAVVLGIVIAIIYFCIRYRAGSSADRQTHTGGPGFGWIELLWTLPILFAFLLFFGWSAVAYIDVYNHTRQTDGGQKINVVAQQWMWKFQHPEGVREINDLHIPVGRPVHLRLTSQDVIHSFFVPAFRVKLDVVPGVYTQLSFTATRPGLYHLFCAEYCGLEHARMRGRIIAMAPADYQDWLQRQPVADTPVQTGARLFRDYGCSGCHSVRPDALGDPSPGTVRAPELAGIFGNPVPLADGTTVMADEQYLRDSILLPEKQVAAGYAPLMPSFQGQISEADILDIITYIKSLSPQQEPPP